jgi:hypothetical protein
MSHKLKHLRQGAHALCGAKVAILVKDPRKVTCPDCRQIVLDQVFPIGLPLLETVCSLVADAIKARERKP